MNYTLRQLRIFAEVTKQQSVTRAADALYLSQPAVSIQLKKFQDQFDLPLTETVGKKIYITDFGRPAKPTHDIFESIPLIYREQGSGTRQTMEQFLNKYNIPVKKKLELTSNEAVKQAILAGLGISIMPLIGIKNELTLGQLKIIPVKGLPIETQWMLLWPKGKNHSPAAAALLQYMDVHRADIMSHYFDWYEKY